MASNKKSKVEDIMHNAVKGAAIGQAGTASNSDGRPQMTMPTSPSNGFYEQNTYSNANLIINDSNS